MSTVDGIARIKVTRGTVVYNLATATDTIECFVETKDLDLGGQDRHVLLSALLVDITNQATSSNMNALFYYKNAPQEAWIGPLSVAMAQATGPLYLNLPEARYWKVRFYDARALSRWKFTRMALFGEVLGLGL